MVVILFLFTCLCSVSTIYGIPSSSSSSSSSLHSPSASVNCLRHERALNDALKSDVQISGQYFSNAGNISRALFPPKKASSKFVLVEVKFYNTSSNITTRSELYIWTLSCIYAVLPRDMLAAVSLGTLYHERERLELSIPEFCQDFPRKETMMVYVLSSLQDLAIIPNSADPRLNTVECVVKINQGHKDINQLVHVKNHSYIQYIIQLFFSVSAGCWFGWILQNDTNTEDESRQKIRLFAFKSTGILVILFLLILQCIVFVMGIMSVISKFQPFVLLVLLVSFINIILAIVLIPKLKCFFSGDDVEFGFSFCLVCCVSYHFLWIFLGAIANAPWTFSILLSICSFYLLVYILVYYNNERYYSTTIFTIGMCIIAVLSLILFLVFAWISVIFFLANELISYVIQSSLTAIVAIAFSYLSYLTPSKRKSQTGPSGDTGEQVPLREQADGR